MARASHLAATSTSSSSSVIKCSIRICCQRQSLDRIQSLEFYTPSQPSARRLTVNCSWFNDGQRTADTWSQHLTGPDEWHWVFGEMDSMVLVCSYSIKYTLTFTSSSFWIRLLSSTVIIVDQIKHTDLCISAQTAFHTTKQFILFQRFYPFIKIYIFFLWNPLTFVATFCTFCAHIQTNNF